MNHTIRIVHLLFCFVFIIIFFYHQLCLNMTLKVFGDPSLQYNLSEGCILFSVSKRCQNRRSPVTVSLGVFLVYLKFKLISAQEKVFPKYRVATLFASRSSHCAACKRAAVSVQVTRASCSIAWRGILWTI